MTDLQSSMPTTPEMPNSEWLRRLRPLIFLACAMAFLADVTHTTALAFGVFYIPLVCITLLHRDSHRVWWVASIAIVMVLVGAILPEVDPNVVELIGNRTLSIVAILLTAALVSHALRVRECLAQQTRRAEAAERMKMEIFTNLGYDLRTPLHAIIGLTQVMRADCRPNQREPLGHVQIASRRLLATINNLVDLTNFEERAPRSEPVDLGVVLRRAVEDARQHAADGQVALVAEIAEPLLPLTGDPWAARRIVENILDNAVKFTPPGGCVTVSAVPSGDTVTVTVTDTGDGMPDDVLCMIGRPFFQAEPGASHKLEGTGTGLALCRRLSDAIGAELYFESAPGVGTSATIRFACQERGALVEAVDVVSPATA